jgi:hypothetical protein
MERQIFPADDNRCQDSRKAHEYLSHALAGARTNRRTATSNCTDYYRSTDHTSAWYSYCGENLSWDIRFVPQCKFHFYCGNDTSNHNRFTVLMNCLMFKAVCMVIWTFTNMNAKDCDQEKLILQICLSYLQFLVMNISFGSMACISHWQIRFSKGGFQSLLMKSLFTWTRI